MFFRTGLFSAAALALFMAAAFSLVPAAAECKDAGALDKFLKKAASHQDCAFDLVLQNRVRGKVRSKEKIAIKCRKDGALYAHWVGKRFKGRELIYRPGWNGGKAGIKEGGASGFSAVSLALDDSAIRHDYRRTIDHLALKMIADEVRKWRDRGKIAAGPGGSGVAITLEGEGRAEVAFTKKGLLKKLVVKDAKGRLLESYELSNVRLNTGMTNKDFDPANPAYGFPGYSAAGIFIDPEKLKKNIGGHYSGIRDYTGVMHKQERINGKLQDKQHIFVKFRKPCDLYMIWKKGPHEGRELIYRHGKDKKVTVHEGGLLGVVTVHVDPNGAMMKRDTNHPLTETDLGFSTKTIYENLSRGLREGEIKLSFKGMKFIGGRRVYLVEDRLPAGKGYYAPRSLNGHDMRTGLPILTTSYDASGRLFEEFEWTDLKFNVGLSDKDFDPKNPEYRF